MKKLRKQVLKHDTFDSFISYISRWFPVYATKYPELKGWKVNDFHMYYRMIRVEGGSK